MKGVIKMKHSGIKATWRGISVVSAGLAAAWIALAATSVMAQVTTLEWKSFDPSRYSQEVTECDRLAGHPDDPHKVVPGLGTRAMDLPAAIQACRTDLTQDAQNPRLQYQLARALTYNGRVTEALPIIEQSAAAGYPQAIFVTGYLYLEGAYSAPKDACRAAELIRESALYGRLAGQLGYPAYVLAGRFEGCAVSQAREELIEFVETARKTRLDYYPAVLAESLLSQLKAAEASAAE
jgi:TPR repeat protein